MTDEALRLMFEHEVGQDDYRRFLEVGVTDRLRFWQERLISRFTLAHPELSLRAGELEKALRVCEGHGEQLLLESVRGVAAEIDRVVTAETRTLFPKANMSPVGLGSGAAERPIAVWFCPSCRLAHSQWHRSVGDARQPLT